MVWQRMCVCLGTAMLVLNGCESPSSSTSSAQRPPTAKSTNAVQRLTPTTPADRTPQQSNLPMRDEDVLQPESADNSDVVEVLAVRLWPQRATIAVGQDVSCEIEVTNNGRVPITSVLLHEELDDGLEEKFGNASPLQVNLGDIPPGGTRLQGLVLKGTREGIFEHRLTVTTDNGQGQQVVKEAMIEVKSQATASLPLQIQVDMPEQISVGETVTATWRVINVRNTLVSTYRVTARHSDSLAPTQATAERHEFLDHNLLVWDAPKPLKAKDGPAGSNSQQFAIVFSGSTPDEEASLHVDVTDENGRRVTRSETIRIVNDSDE